MMTWEELSGLTKTRRSIRKFQDKPVPEDVLVKALELATWAPNSGNSQAWRFLIVSDKKLIQKMGDIVRAKAELQANWPEAEQHEELVVKLRQNCDFFRGAPVLIAVLMGKYFGLTDTILKARGETDPVAREIMSNRAIARTTLQTTAAATTYLCLFLHYFGIGTTWMGGPLQAKKEIEELLNVPPEWDFVALIPAGYPAEAPAPRARKPIQDVIQFFR